MSPVPFPDRVDASRWFSRHGRIDAQLSLAKLDRLAPLLATTDGCVKAVLQFGADAEGNKLLTGELRGEVTVVCQRCLEPMPFRVMCELALLVFGTREELAQYQQDHGHASLERDCIVLDESGGGLNRPSETELDLLALVEDELLLSVPLAPMHEDEGCNEVLQRLRQQSEVAEREAQAQKVSPFAVLAQLKKPK